MSGTLSDVLGYSAGDLYRQSTPVLEGSGADWSYVYFLFCGGEIVYVGRTDSPHRRIGEHLNEERGSPGSEHFGRVAVLRVPDDMTGRIEKHFISKFEPRYNEELSGSESGEFKFPLKED